MSEFKWWKCVNCGCESTDELITVDWKKGELCPWCKKNINIKDVN